MVMRGETVPVMAHWTGPHSARIVNKGEGVQNRPAAFASDWLVLHHLSMKQGSNESLIARYIELRPMARKLVGQEVAKFSEGWMDLHCVCHRQRLLNAV